MLIVEINAILTTYWPAVMEFGSPQNIYEEKRRAQSAAVIYEVLGPIGSSVETPEDTCIGGSGGEAALGTPKCTLKGWSSNHKEHFTLLEIKGMQN